MAVVSSFLYHGCFIDYTNTFDTTEEPDEGNLIMRKEFAKLLLSLNQETYNTGGVIKSGKFVL